MRFRQISTPRFHSQLVIALLLISSVGCAGNPSPSVSPQASIAHHGAATLNAVAELQRGVTAAAQARPAFVPAARQITAVVEQIHTRAGQLGEALRAYDAATTLDLRNLSEAQVQQTVANINGLLVDAFNVKITDATGVQVSALIANVARVVATLSAEIAKLRSQPL
jgi:hypothetical protein